MIFSNVLTPLALAGSAFGHMHLHYPPSLGGDNNPNTKTADPFLNYPYGCCGKKDPGPCHGHVNMLDTDEGKPVATWSAGQKVNFTLSGARIDSPIENPIGGTHYGGSCQVGFSVDKGKSFKVATTWQGNCPLRDGTLDPSTQVFDFTVPADTPSGERVLFAWTWVNREKEFNMGCASVTISGKNTSPEQPQAPAPSSAAPKPSSPSAPAKPQPSPAKYTLEGCACSCPSQTWTSACQCFDCDSPSTKRHLVERKVLEMHKRTLQNAAKLNVPHRRAEAIAFNSRPDMLIGIDYAGAKCHSKGDPVELEFPNPGPNVVMGDREYELAQPSC
jgi:hypothetical protein